MSCILPTSYFPEAGYLKMLQDSGPVIIDVGEHFIKQTLRNRTLILGANGPLKLIVPLKRWRNNTAVKDIQISYDENWQKLHWRSIESAYRNSPYFEYYEADLRLIILEQKESFLVDLNQRVLDFLLKKLNISAEIHVEPVYQTGVPIEEDYREANRISELTVKNEQTYTQVFPLKSGFVSGLGAIDLICNEGPNTIHLL